MLLQLCCRVSTRSRPTRLVDESAKIFALHMLESHVRHSLILTHFVHPTDVRMLEPGQGDHLAAETQARDLAVQIVGADRLQSHPASQVHVFSRIDRARAT